jgi:3-oxoacyl-[acyl-carrier-protein] synthase III
MESRTDRTRFEGDANFFLHKAKATQAGAHRVFNGESALIALAHWMPEKVKTVNEIEKEITLFPGSLLALERRTGLKEKHICDTELRIVDLAMKAVDELIRRKTWDGQPIPIDEIDLVIYFGLSREYLEPATAILIQNRLGLTGRIAFDISNACLGFLNAWSIADAMIASGRIRKALLVSGEKIARVSDEALKVVNEGGDVRQQFASFTIGDGSVAAIVGKKSDNSRGVKLSAGLCETFAEHCNLCIVKSYTEGIMNTDAKELFDTALSKHNPLVNAVIDHLNLDLKDFDTFIMHQASIPAVAKCADIIGVPFSKFVNTFAENGNMATVSLPFTLSVAMDKLHTWKKQRIMLIGFASGIGVGVFGLETCGN